MNADIISDAIAQIRTMIGEGLISTGMTGPEGLVIVGYNYDEGSSGFSIMLTNFVRNALTTSGFAPLGRFHMGRLANNALGIIFVEHDYCWSMTLDLNKVNLGIIMNIVVPRALKAMDVATEQVTPRVA
ncbi:MAG: hypothetical protein HC933_14925 [Pleurocapsa sp. SU_196_0]|nr:hypothetical protein [Pleurocapsa sp. SU_196_0]